MEVDEATLSRIIEAHVAAYSNIIMARVSAMIGARPHPIGRDGIIQSYDPTDGTVEVIFGDGAAIITGRGGDGDQSPIERRVPLLVTHHGDQFGPVGGERCVMVPTQSGYAAMMIYDTDDSPNAPGGERWITHRNAAGTVDATVKLTNDGHAGDGLGGASVGGGGSLTTVTTSDPQIASTHDATNGTLTHQAGAVKTVHDKAHGMIGVGDAPMSLAATDAAFTKQHITALATSIMSDMLQSFSSVYSAAMITAGITNATAFNVVVKAAGWVTSNVTAPTVPTGSTITRIKS